MPTRRPLLPPSDSTSAPCSRATSAVRSVEPSSTTRTSASGSRSCSASRTDGRLSSSFHAGMKTAVSLDSASDRSLPGQGEAATARPATQRAPRRLRRERVAALDAILLEVVDAVRTEDDGPVLRRARQHPPDMRVRAERREQPRVPLLDLLERQPLPLAEQVDETEVAGSEDDDVACRDIAVRRLLRRRADGLTDGMPDHRVLLVAALDLRHRCVVDAALDDVVEPVAIPLPERRALRLPVVGEHDELVRAGGLPACAHDAAEQLIELTEFLL